MDNQLYTFIQAGFAILTIVCMYALYRMIRRGVYKTDFASDTKRRILTGFLIGLIAWGILVSGLSLAGVLGDFSSFPPKMMIVLVVPLVTIIWAIRTKTLNEILIHIPPHHIVRLQVFRFFVEILLWMLLIAELLPIQMSFEGRNFDILAGLTAPVIAYLFKKKILNSTWLKVWNFLCLGLLINIVTIAFLSMPTPLRVFINESVNTIVAVFPIVWLPAFLVPLAYTLHLFSLKQMYFQKMA
jgi:hypothetical protein